MNNTPQPIRAHEPTLDVDAARAGIVGLIAGDLAEVEKLFRRNLASPLRIVDEIGTFVADGGGKRVRPTLHLLCAKLCRYRGSDAVLLATVLEFIHSATLIHDDILDDATTRRGRPSVNSSWGNSVTVLFGDYLFAKAMEMALRTGSLRVMERLADVTLRMTEGEMLQTRYAGRVDLTEEEYLDLVDRKTAALFACCCELAGILAGVEPEREAALARYGRNLGMAFQLVDDLLDFTGDADVLGKPAASDLLEGKATLAVIDLLATGDGEARRLIERVMELGADPAANGSGRGAEAIARLTRRMHETGAIGRARARAAAYADAAAAELEGFSEGAAHRALRSLPDLLVHRDR